MSQAAQAAQTTTPAWVAQMGFKAGSRYETRNGMTRGTAVEFMEQSGERFVVLNCTGGGCKPYQIPININDIK